MASEHGIRVTKPLSAVIVNYRQADLCITCIETMLKHRVVSLANIVVVNNGSDDDSSEKILSKFPGARVIQSPENGGFGAGVNLGVQHTDSELILVLNPDTRFTKNSVGHLQSLFERDDKLAVIGMMLLNPDGTRQYSARRFYTWLDIFLLRTFLRHSRYGRARLGEHLMKESSSDAIFPTDWVMGTGFVARRSAFDDVNGMDARYFLYMEDVDFCMRLWRNGWTVACDPCAVLIHDHQRRSARYPFSRASLTHLRSLARFHRKFRIPLLYRPRISELNGGRSLGDRKL